jgi:A/G-specific adenine glycosylase
MADIPYTLLQELLMHPPSSHSDKEPLKKLANSNSSYDVAKVIQVMSAGDVVHVFSHIKKTYRVQWVLLEGNELPQLRPTVSIEQGARENGSHAKNPKGKQKVSEVSEVELNAIQQTLSAQWVPLAKVEDTKLVFSRLVYIIANNPVISFSIGTGVLKVWKLVEKLWVTTQ